MSNSNAYENADTIGKMSKNRSTSDNSDIAENAKTIENKKEDRKAIKKFALIMALCFVGGMLGGFLSAVIKDMEFGVGEAFMGILSAIAPYGNVVFTTILLITDMIIIKKSRKDFLLWDGEDEDWIEGIEQRLTYATIFVSVHMVLMYFFMSTGMYFIDFDELDNAMTVVRIAALLIGIFYALFVNTMIQKQIVNLEKEINPEKKGSVFDAKFQKKWMDSCDESERFQIYQASYKSFQVTGYVCMGVWLFCFVGMLSWNFGLLPMIMVLIIWLALILSYQIECLRMSRRK